MPSPLPPPVTVASSANNPEADAVGSAQRQRIGHATRAIAAKVRHRRKVVGKVRRHRRQARRVAVAVLLAAHRPRLVQNQRVRRPRFATTAFGPSSSIWNTPVPRSIAAVSLSPSASVTVCTNARRNSPTPLQRQRRGVVVAAGVAVPDVVRPARTSPHPSPGRCLIVK